MTDRIIIIRESLFSSIVSDLVSVAALLGSVAIGVWIGSQALQWIAGLMAIIVILGRVQRKNIDGRMTIDEARAELDRIESERTR